MRKPGRRWLGLELALLAGMVTACGPPGEPDPCGTEVTQVPNEGWLHYPEDTEIPYAHNPPASGPHYPVWARYTSHAVAVPRPYWVHNIEHGAVVFLHGLSATAELVTALEDAYQATSVDPVCQHPRALLTPDPYLDRAIAVVAANYVLESSCVPAQAIADFVAARRGAGPEDVCDEGTYPP